jgi:hypothetical protein
MPSTKVTAAALAVAVGSIVVYLIETLGRVDLPTGVEAAIVVILTFLAGYLTPESNPAPSAVETVQKRGLG